MCCDHDKIENSNKFNSLFFVKLLICKVNEIPDGEVVNNVIKSDIDRIKYCSTTFQRMGLYVSKILCITYDF